MKRLLAAMGVVVLLSAGWFAALAAVTGPTTERMVRDSHYRTYWAGGAGDAVALQLFDNGTGNDFMKQIQELRFQVTPNGSDVVSLWIDSANGTAYDTVLTTASMASNTSYYWAPGERYGPMLGVDDVFRVTYGNTGESAWTAEVIWRRFY